MSPSHQTEPIRNGLSPTRAGHGPSLQRDYWAQIRESRLAASEVGEFLARRFGEMVPDSIAHFTARRDPGQALEVGDEMEVWIRFVGRCGVRVVHRDKNSITFATLEGHPEAGRITFGAYRHDSGNLVFHIRSRARSSNTFHYLGFRALGRAMQTETWTRFVDKVAATIGRGVLDFVYEETRPAPEEGPEADLAPTFVAEGD